MSLSELIPLLLHGTPAEQARAGRALLSWIERATGHVREEWRDALRDDVRFNFWRRLLSGEPPRSPEAFLRTMIANAESDQHRRWQTRKPAPLDDESLSQPALEEALAEHELDREADRKEALGALEALFRVYERSVLPRYKEERAAAMEQLLQVQRGRSLRDLLLRDEALNGADEAAIERALLRAYKAHSRLRADLLACARGLRALGEISPARARFLEGCLKLLERAGVRGRKRPRAAAERSLS